MSRKPQILGQVAFKDKSERASIQGFCREYFGRSFSAQCRHMLLKAKREAAGKAQAKPGKAKP
jgi:hypothetical protein